MCLVTEHLCDANCLKVLVPNCMTLVCNAQVIVQSIPVCFRSAEITLPVIYIMMRGTADSQVTLCGECIMARGIAGSQVTLCGEWFQMGQITISC